MPLLGVNIDHVATVRQARREGTPDLLEAARVVISAGATGITAHLREDRRHIQDDDIRRLKKNLTVPLNMEMSVSPVIVDIALEVRPAWACLVPEKRQELTTEGGLDVGGQFDAVAAAVSRLKAAGIKVSLFVEPDIETIRICKQAQADAVEIHTGRYARVFNDVTEQKGELDRIYKASTEAANLGLIVNAGHGLDTTNVSALVSTYAFHEFNIGFSIIARSIFVGLSQATAEMTALLSKGSK